MIKFFRKIRQNLLMDNKTGKYFKYAIGEIALVMIGILLALQVNNWNDNRNLENKTIRYLENLNTEVEANLVYIKKYTKIIHRDIIESANTLKKLHSKEAKYFNDSVLRINMNTRPIYKSILDRSTFDDLINSGVLEHLTNTELKNKILAIPSFMEKLNENHILAKDVWDDYQVPYLMKHSNVSGNWSIIRGVKIEKPNFKRTKEAFIHNKD